MKVRFVSVFIILAFTTLACGISAPDIAQKLPELAESLPEQLEDLDGPIPPGLEPELEATVGAAYTMEATLMAYDPRFEDSSASWDRFDFLPQPDYTPIAKPEADTYMVGQTVPMGNMYFTLLNWVHTYEPGYEYVVTDMIFTADAGSARYIDPSLAFHLKDQNGVEFSPTSWTCQNFWVNPGVSTLQRCSFNVPLNQGSRLYFLFDPTNGGVDPAVGSKPFYVDLGPVQCGVGFPPQTLPELQPFGQSYRVGPLQVTVLGIEYQQADEFWYGDSLQAAVLTLSIQNVSGQTVTVNPLNEYWLRDSIGRDYAADPSVLTGTALSTTEILPGGTLTGQISYPVPVDTTIVAAIWDANWLSGGQVFFSVQ